MRVGIVGAGQLAQMMAEAAKHLHLDTLCLALTSEDCAGRVSALEVVPALESQYVKHFLDQSDIITIETENIPLDFAQYLADHKPFRPAPNALKIAQDRLFEKQLFEAVGLPPAPYATINDESDIPAAFQQIGVPGILKTRRLGYDGKGQIRCNTESELYDAVKALSPALLIYEGFVAFDLEVSLLGVRSVSGETAFYPLCDNKHREGILRETKAPFHDDALTAHAQQYMRDILTQLDYVGVFTIEFFVKGSALIGNEMAPRVHNSGHWTIEGAKTSQFENHLRAITGMSLGSCDPIGSSVMTNCIGELPDPADVARIPGAHLHVYGKTLKPLRKVGHVTVVHGGKKDQ